MIVFPNENVNVDIKIVLLLLVATVTKASAGLIDPQPQKTGPGMIWFAQKE